MTATAAERSSSSVIPPCGRFRETLFSGGFNPTSLRAFYGRLCAPSSRESGLLHGQQPDGILRKPTGYRGIRCHRLHDGGGPGAAPCIQENRRFVAAAEPFIPPRPRFRAQPSANMATSFYDGPAGGFRWNSNLTLFAVLLACQNYALIGAVSGVVPQGIRSFRRAISSRHGSL